MLMSVELYNEYITTTPIQTTYEKMLEVLSYSFMIT